MISDFLSDRQGVGTSQWGTSQYGAGRQTNALQGYMSGNPVNQAYAEMYGSPSFGGGNYGDGDDVSNGVSAGTASGAANGTTAGAAKGTGPGSYETPSFNLAGIGGAVGTGLSMATKGAVPGLSAFTGAFGMLGDIEATNAALAERGFGQIDTLEAAKNYAAKAALGIFDPTPGNLISDWAVDKVGFGASPRDQYGAMMGFGLGPSVERDDYYEGQQYGANAAQSMQAIDDAQAMQDAGWNGGWNDSWGSFDDTMAGAADAQAAADAMEAANQQDIDENNAANDDSSDDDSIICTELMRQGRLSKRLWLIGTKEFQGYWEHGKRGYYLWSIPVVRHLKAHPESRFSGFIEKLFNIRAEYVAARNGHKRYRKTLLGAVVTKGMYGLCWSLAVCSALVQGFPHRRPRPVIVFGRPLMNHGRSTAGVKFVQGDKKPLRCRRGLGDRFHTVCGEVGVRSCQLTVHECVGLHQFRDKFRKNFGHLFVHWDANVRHFTLSRLLAQIIGVVKTFNEGVAHHHAAEAAQDYLCVCVETAGVGQITGRLDWWKHVSRLLNLRGLSARGKQQGRQNGQYDLSHSPAAYTPSYEARNA